jgi:hypothetical protein
LTALVPWPASVAAAGELFALGPRTTLSCDPAVEGIGELLREQLGLPQGRHCAIRREPAPPLRPEAYRLEVGLAVPPSAFSPSTAETSRRSHAFARNLRVDQAHLPATAYSRSAADSPRRDESSSQPPFCSAMR